MDPTRNAPDEGGSDAVEEAEFLRLESLLRQLKVQYDMYFGGGIKREPLEMRRDVERLIRHYSHQPGRKYAQRFHLNTLVSKFNSMSELWNKTARSREEGNHHQAPPVEPGVRERLLTRCTLADVASDPEGLKRLHSRYVYARRRAGIEHGLPSYEAFVRSVDAQVQKLRRQARCDQIELRLIVRDDKVQLKARPGR